MQNSSNKRGWRQLLICCFVIGFVWLVVLPKIASQPNVEARLDWLEERKIDPSAMFYTELEAMEPILEKLNARQWKGRD